MDETIGFDLEPKVPKRIKGYVSAVLLPQYLATCLTKHAYNPSTRPKHLLRIVLGNGLPCLKTQILQIVATTVH